MGRLLLAICIGPSAWYGFRYGNHQDHLTLPADQIEQIRALIESGQAASVSAFVKHAVGVALFDAAGWSELLQDALQQTGGPLTKTLVSG